MTSRLARLLAAGVIASGVAPRTGADCTTSATPVAFGVYDVFAVTPLDSTGTITFQCENKDKDVRVSLGRGGASTFAGRRMKSGGNELGYGLYLDAARTVVWGDGTEGSSVYFDKNPLNKLTTLTLYGRVPSGQDVAAGAYSDSIVAQIDF